MLVLTQKADDTILIGDNITVTILRVRGQAVQVGIEAPRDIRVLRSSLVESAPPRERNDASGRMPAEVPTESRLPCRKPR